ncbi:MAG TPA: VCBS repeat-containing protein, partial [Solirubrobacteraceae bacterium]
MSRAVGFCFLVAIGCRRPAEAPFVDITATAGLDGAVPSYDAALADFDGDGRIDVYVGNHGAGAALYRNIGDGRFNNVIATVGVEPGGDQHGAGWGDVDGDGRPDLYVGLGAERGRGTKANRLYQNVG